MKKIKIKIEFDSIISETEIEEFEKDGIYYLSGVKKALINRFNVIIPSDVTKNLKIEVDDIK